MKKGKSDVEDLVDIHSKKFPPIHDRLIPSQYMAVDYIFGGGFPENRIISVTANYGVGKTLFSLCMCMSLLMENKENVVLYLDVERGISESLLVNVLGDDYKSKYKNRFILLAPQSYEDTETLIEDFFKTGKLKLVVLDSLTALETQKVLDKESAQIGSKAGAETKFCKLMKFYSCAGKFSIIYINQQRANISFSYAPGPATKMAGSHAVYFYSDVILLLKAISYDRNAKKEKVGAQILLQCEKNRLVGNRKAAAFFRYGHGISNIKSVTHLLKWADVVSNAGAYFDFVDENFDFGSGVGEKHRVRGVEEAEAVVRSKMADIIEHYTNNGQIAKYFEKVTK